MMVELVLLKYFCHSCLLLYPEDGRGGGQSMEYRRLNE
jgi:hypothetical protein